VRRPSRAWLILPAVLIAAAIAPHGWLAQHCPVFGALFQPFCAAVGERGGHATVFLLVGGALLWAVPALRRDLVAYLLILASIGIAQECVQLLWKARASGVNELHDLAVDLAAGAVMWLGFRAGAVFRTRAGKASWPRRVGPAG